MQQKTNRVQTSRRGLRKLWFNIHLYLGLTVGFLFVLIGLTGACNVFWVEIDEVLNPQLTIEESHGEYLPLEELFATVKSFHPEREGSWTLRMPRNSSAVLRIFYQKPEEKADEFFAPLMFSVNPYTAEIVAERYWGDTLTTFIYNIHEELLLGEIGWDIMGILGLVLMVSLATGLYLWWPRPGKFRQALFIKQHTNSARFMFDLHRVTGIYGFTVLFILAFSGVKIVYPDYVKPLVSVFSSIADEFKLESKVVQGSQPITIGQAINIADGVFPDAKLKWTTTPDGTKGVYVVRKRQLGEANIIHPSSLVYIDQYSGKVLMVRDPNKFSAGETFLNLMWPLHTGEVLGLPGRILICITGFVPLFLYITGITRWLQKRKAKKSRKIKQSKITIT